jgi:hypothetical protein
MENESDLSDGFFAYEITEGTVAIAGYKGSEEQLAIPDKINGLPVTSIGANAFSLCDSLIGVVIPDSVISIGDGAFHGCSSLISITVDSRNPAYTSNNGVLFDKRMRKLIQCPARKSGDYTIPDSVAEIGDIAFSGCASLTSITISDSVESIGYIAFSGCTGLTGITADSRNPNYTSVNGILFDKRMRKLVQYLPGKSGGYTIPDSVTEIGDGAFYRCVSLTSIAIPGSVVSIGDSAFSDCISLISVDIPDSVVSIENYAFDGCLGLTSVAIPGSVVSIGDCAFACCSGLTSVTIPNSISKIRNNVFTCCTGLISVVIPDSVVSIEDYAFSNCDNLKSVTLSRKTSVASDAFPDSAQIQYSD